MLGQFGHFFTILAFISSWATIFCYAKTEIYQKEDWKKTARFFLYLHALAVLGIIVCLYAIVYFHHFEYHYAWSHSSKSLPVYYVISSFWEGQEGSFLLWMFWHVVLSFFLVKKKWESSLLLVFMAVQGFLCSMILGIVLPWTDLKIGSSPFLLLKEAMPDLPVWKTKPDFIPEDGRGLNPLLQNYWMVIHPPVLFLGFGLSLIPFCYGIVALWKAEFVEWLKPARFWVLLNTLVLGVGILMGAYWAYETLNFGGYWNWDPVENAVYVPWVVAVAALHTLRLRSQSLAIRYSLILCITTFLLILYSTFLTRSGILGNASVHSFTDLGLSGQLLIYLLFFVLFSVGLLSIRWKKIPSESQDLSVYSASFWLFLGAFVLLFSAFQVLLTTSIPVYSKIIEFFGGQSNLALPTDQVAHYNKFQLWFGILIAFLSAIGQFFWWKTKEMKTQFRPIFTPLTLSLLLASLLITVLNINRIPLMILLIASLFSIFGNGIIVWDNFRKKIALSGGLISHIGIALFLIGILFSAGYSKVISLNSTGRAIVDHQAFTQNDNKENRENIPLFVGKTAKMNDYEVTFKGRRIKARTIPGFLHQHQVELIENDFRAVALEDLKKEDKLYYKKGDTLDVFPENKYYEIELKSKNDSVVIYPRWQINPKMGNALSPDLYHTFSKDIYAYVSLDPNAESDQREWSGDKTHFVALKENFFVNDYVANLEKIELVKSVHGIELGAEDFAVKAHIRLLDQSQSRLLTPLFIIKNRLVASPIVSDTEMGVRLKIKNIDTQKGKLELIVNTTQRDFIVLKALEKPYISLLWSGAMLTFLGMIVALRKK